MLKPYIYLLHILFLVLLQTSPSYGKESNKLKVLHLTFHKGCAKAFEAVAKKNSFDLETWFIHDLPPYSFDGTSKGSALYNIGHDRAQRIWDLHKEKFNTFDVIVTSDTAPLARIFLQNEWEKPLIIWICNRFDYYDGASLDCEFPDPEFYDLFRNAKHKSNVTYVAYTAFEHYYAKSKGVDTGSLIITPFALSVKDENQIVSRIPSQIVKKESFFLPPYHNETNFMDFSAFCTNMGIPNYCGRYNGPLDLKDFKGIIHLPYSWSNLALFENINLGIPYFIPSQSFFHKLLQSANYFHPNANYLTKNHLFHLSEWYSPEHSELFVYFDSWDDLRNKIQTTNCQKKRKQIKAYAKKHRMHMIAQWKMIFGNL